MKRYADTEADAYANNNNNPAVRRVVKAEGQGNGVEVGWALTSSGKIYPAQHACMRPTGPLSCCCSIDQVSLPLCYAVCVYLSGGTYATTASSRLLPDLTRPCFASPCPHQQDASVASRGDRVARPRGNVCLPAWQTCTIIIISLVHSYIHIVLMAEAPADTTKPLVLQYREGDLQPSLHEAFGRGEELIEVGG